MNDKPATADEPLALTMPPMVLLSKTRIASLLARARVGDHITGVWWAKIALPLGPDVTMGDPKMENRWVTYKMLTRVDGVDHQQVPTLPAPDSV